MKRLILGIALIPALLISTTVLAQESENPVKPTETPTEATPAVDETSPTETMWFYLQQQKRYDDPQIAIRRKAEWKSAQRRLRLASQRWFGYSASRPIASPTPMMGVYSPMWIGNGTDPFYWVGAGFATRTSVRVTSRVETTATKR